MTTKDYILNTMQQHKSNLELFGARRIGLFGSYIRGEQTIESDIDILIEFDPEQENFDNYMALCDYFEKLFNNEKVEIATTSGLSKYIGPNILNEVHYV